MNNEDTVLIFTGKSASTVLDEGGTQAWKLDPARAKKCTWVVCTQNAHNPHEYADGRAPHRSAFLIGRISRISAATDTPGRWKIEFNEYAIIDIPETWPGDRNPVRYTSLSSLGINPDATSFRQFEPNTTTEPARSTTQEGLTIKQAKAGLAATYGVSTDCIEITIRG